MRITSNIFLVLIVGLTFNSVKSQSFFSSKNVSVSSSYGCGKIQYFADHSPSIVFSADPKVIEYSPSWSFKIGKTFWLNNRFDFSIALSHITLTEKSKNVALPYWFDFSEKHYRQGFFHIIPSIILKLPGDRFNIKVGLRLGTANFIGNYLTRQSSNSFLSGDIALESGSSIRISKRWFLEGDLVYGFTRYDYTIGMPVEGISYFKYHSFQLGIRYILHEAKGN
ncbi:MAG: hypothetical protein ABJB16_07050 [Saprospiraceae bacterium]